MKFVLVTLGVVCIATISLGTKDIKSMLGVRHCSAFYWILYIWYLAYFCVMIKYWVSHVFEEHKSKLLYGYNFNKNDIRWSRKSVDLLVMVAFFCGVLSSITGMGGGMIYAPLLLALNLHPSVATSTATLFNFFSSLANAIFAILTNQVYFDYAMWLWAWTSFGTILGLFFVKDLIDKTNRTSIVVFVLVVVLILATFITTLNEVGEIDMDMNNPTGSITWGSFWAK